MRFFVQCQILKPADSQSSSLALAWILTAGGQYGLQCKCFVGKSWEELNGDGTLQEKVFITTLNLHMCSHGTTNCGVNWHGRGWHGVWQWLVPEQCFITVHVTIDVSFIPCNEKFQLLHILVSLNRTGSCVIVHAVANIPTGGPHWNCGSLAVLSQRRDGNHLQQKIIHYLRVL